MSRSVWSRRRQGYMRRDGAWFLERGALMVGGRTHAWLIYRRVTPDRIGTDSPTLYDLRTAFPLWAIDPDGLTSTVTPGFRGPVYAHELDAGSLAEAKYAVEATEQHEADQHPPCT